MGVIAEHFYDEKGLIWPKEIAPAQVYLISIGEDVVTKLADELYNVLTESGVAVIYDDRDVRPGEKFADADLMGIPWRVVINRETTTNGKYEIKGRTEASPINLAKDSLLERVSGLEKRPS